MSRSVLRGAGGSGDPEVQACWEPPPACLRFWFLPPPSPRLQETSEDADPPLPPFHFQRLLANLTALRVRTRPSPSGQ